MNRKLLAGLVLLAAMLVLIQSPQATSHAQLVRAVPGPGSVVRETLKVVRLWFDEELDPRRSTLKVTDHRGARVDDGKGGVDLTDMERASMVARLRSLRPGKYTVRWTAVSVDDLFVAQGAFQFTLGPPRSR